MPTVQCQCHIIKCQQIYFMWQSRTKNPVCKWTVNVCFVCRKSLKQKLIDLYIEDTHKEPFCKVNSFKITSTTHVPYRMFVIFLTFLLHCSVLDPDSGNSLFDQWSCIFILKLKECKQKICSHRLNRVAFMFSWLSLSQVKDWNELIVYELFMYELSVCYCPFWM